MAGSPQEPPATNGGTLVAKGRPPRYWRPCGCCGDGLQVVTVRRRTSDHRKERGTSTIDTADLPPPSTRRLRFLSRWARLRLGTLEFRSHPQNLVERQRPIVNQVIAAAAPWAARLRPGVSKQDEEVACRHLGVLVRFLRKEGVAEILRATNNLSGQEWLEPSGELEEEVEELLRVWHRRVLPTLAALQRMPKPRVPDDWEEPCADCLALADWSARYLDKYPLRKQMSFLRSTSRLFGLSGNQSYQAASFRSCEPDSPFEFEDALEPPPGAEHELEPESDSDAGDLFESFLSHRSGNSSLSRSGLFASLLRIGGDGPQSWDFRRGAAQHGWDEAIATEIPVRSASFLKDKAKAPSLPSLLEVVHLDLFDVEQAGGYPHISVAPGGVVQELRKAGERRFLFVVNFCMAPLQLACVFAEHGAISASAPLVAEGGPAGELLRRFVGGMSDDERRARFKVIPWVREGPWLVQKAVGRTPAIIGKKLEVNFFHEAHDHFEVSVNIFSSSAAQRILSLVKGAASALTMEVFFVLEARENQELPERIIGGFRASRGDLTRTRGPI